MSLSKSNIKYLGNKLLQSTFNIDHVGLNSSSAPSTIRYKFSRVPSLRAIDSTVDEIKLREYQDSPNATELPGEAVLSERAKHLMARNAKSLADGNGPISVSSTELALARGAGGDNDPYVPGILRERAYLMAGSTLSEKQFDQLKEAELIAGDDDEEGLLERLHLPSVRRLDLADMIPLGIDLARMEQEPEALAFPDDGEDLISKNRDIVYIF